MPRPAKLLPLLSAETVSSSPSLQPPNRSSSQDLQNKLLKKNATVEIESGALLGKGKQGGVHEVNLSVRTPDDHTKISGNWVSKVYYGHLLLPSPCTALTNCETPSAVTHILNCLITLSPKTEMDHQPPEITSPLFRSGHDAVVPWLNHNTTHFFTSSSKSSNIVVSLMRKCDYVLDFHTVSAIIKLKKKNLPLYQFIISSLFNQILIGLRTLRDKKIVHRDLKPNNIGFIDDFTLVIFDCDIAQSFSFFNKKRCLNHTDLGFAGTAGYVAPEIFDGTINDPSKIDIYSVGKIFAKLLSFNDEEPKGVYGCKTQPMENVENFHAEIKKARSFEECMMLMIRKMCTAADCRANLEQLDMAAKKLVLFVDAKRNDCADAIQFLAAVSSAAKKQAASLTSERDSLFPVKTSNEAWPVAMGSNHVFEVGTAMFPLVNGEVFCADDSDDDRLIL